ncbi:MAG: hypothetical protein ACKPB0_00655, partial [Opitutaceae bacterium]
PNLVFIGAKVARGSNLEFQSYDRRSADDHRVEPATDARNNVFQEYRAGKPIAGRLKDSRRGGPGVALRFVDGKLTAQRELSDDAR